MREATVDGRNPAPVDVVVSPIIYRVFLHSRWCRISSINSIITSCITYRPGVGTVVSRPGARHPVFCPGTYYPPFPVLGLASDGAFDGETYGENAVFGHPKWWFVAMAYYAQKKQNGYYVTKQFENQCFIHCLWILCVHDCFPCVFDGKLYTLSCFFWPSVPRRNPEHAIAFHHGASMSLLGCWCPWIWFYWRHFCWRLRLLDGCSDSNPVSHFFLNMFVKSSL